MDQVQSDPEAVSDPRAALSPEQRVAQAQEAIQYVLATFGVTLQVEVAQARNVGGKPPQLLLDLGFRVVAV